MSDRDVREAIQHLAGTNKTDNIFLVDANVDSYNESTRTCTCTLIGGQASNTLPNVRLLSSVDDGLLKLPTVDTTVTIILSSFTEPVVIGYSGLDKMIMLGGDLGGLPIVGALLEKINNLEKAYNDLVSKFNAHIHPETGTNTGPTPTQETTVLTLTELDEIENKNITQG